MGDDHPLGAPPAPLLLHDIGYDGVSWNYSKPTLADVLEKWTETLVEAKDRTTSIQSIRAFLVKELDWDPLQSKRPASLRGESFDGQDGESGDSSSDGVEQRSP